VPLLRGDSRLGPATAARAETGVPDRTDRVRAGVVLGGVDARLDGEVESAAATLPTPAAAGFLAGVAVVDMSQRMFADGKGH
jgi:hypothetical protein